MSGEQHLASAPLEPGTSKAHQADIGKFYLTKGAEKRLPAHGSRGPPYPETTGGHRRTPCSRPFRGHDKPNRGMSGKSVELRRWLIYGGRDWPTWR